MESFATSNNNNNININSNNNNTAQATKKRKLESKEIGDKPPPVFALTYGSLTIEIFPGQVTDATYIFFIFEPKICW